MGSQKCWVTASCPSNSVATDDEQFLAKLADYRRLAGRAVYPRWARSLANALAFDKERPSSWFG